jgi:outer membrane protein
MGRYLTIKHVMVFCCVVMTAFGGHYIWRTHQKNLRIKPIPNAQIAFVNLTRLRNEAQAFIKFRELIERQYKIFKDDIHTQEKNILDEYTALEQKRLSKMKGKADLQKDKEALDQKMKEMSTIIHEKKTALHQNFSKITEKIEAAIREIVANLAQKHRLNLIFNATVMDASVVLYGGPELDVTDEVLSLLNREIPTVHLEE